MPEDFSPLGERVNIASALIKQVLVLQDFDTWSSVRKDYLPAEYHTVFSTIDKHYDKYHSLPTFEDLKFEVRDTATLEKLYAIQSVDVDVDAFMLLQYLKNEYTQKEILDSLEDSLGFLQPPSNFLQIALSLPLSFVQPHFKLSSSFL